MSTIHAPTELDEALALMGQERPPVVLAGGTDLWPQWTADPGAPRPEQVLSLHRLERLRGIELTDGALHIGATCTHRDLVRSALVREHCPALAEAAATIGAVQIQNRGTVGGNIVNGSPAADLPPPLMAASAAVELASAARGTRQVELDRLFTGYRSLDRRPDELLVAVRVPVLPPGARDLFRKVGTRRAQAISKVVGACRIALDGGGAIGSVGMAFGSVGPTPLRLSALEAWLVGRLPDEATAAEAGRRAAAVVTPIDDLRSSAAYRQYAAGRIVRGWIIAVA